MTTVDINTERLSVIAIWTTPFSIPILKDAGYRSPVTVAQSGRDYHYCFIDMNNEDHRRRVLHSLEQG